MSFLMSKYSHLWEHEGFRQAPALVAFRLLAWRVRCWLNLPAVIDLPRWQARFLVPAKWKGGGATMIFATREYYEPELILMERFISKGSVVIDAGANCGIYTVATSKLVGNSGIVLSFEPGAESFSVLEHNLEINHLNNVRLFHCALSDSEGKTRLYHIRDMPNSYSLGSDLESSEKYEEIMTTTLDKVLQQQGIVSVDFLKMDVEGAEELMIRGAKSLFNSKRPVITFEINGNAAARLGLAKDGAWKLLADLDYQFFTVGNTGDLKELYTSPPGTSNVVAIPRGQN